MPTLFPQPIKYFESSQVDQTFRRFAGKEVRSIISTVYMCLTITSRSPWILAHNLSRSRGDRFPSRMTDNRAALSLNSRHSIEYFIPYLGTWQEGFQKPHMRSTSTDALRCITPRRSLTTVITTISCCTWAPIL